MLVDIPIVYTANVTMPHGKAAKAVKVRHLHTVRIEEHSDDEAPIACRRKTDAFARADFDVFEIVRYRGGQFWRSVPVDIWAEGSREVWHTADSFKALASGENTSDSDHPVPYRTHSHQLRSAFPDIASTGAKKVHDTDLDEITAKADEGAERFIVVDGMAYVRTSEPVYVYTGRSNYRASYLETELHNRKSPVGIFRLDDFDALLAMANQCSVDDLYGSESKTREDHEPYRADILLPGVFLWDPQRESLRLSIGKIIDDARRVAPDMNTETFAGYAALRDHVGEDADAAVDDEELAKRAALARDLIRSVRTWVPDRHDWNAREEIRADRWLEKRRDLENDLEYLGSLPTP